MKNTKNILELVNELPICSEGKLGVINILEAIGIDITVPKCGEVWLTTSERIVIISEDSDSVQIDDIFSFKGSDLEGAKFREIGAQVSRNTILDGYYCAKLANSPKEYFGARENILEKLRGKFPL